LFAQNGSRWRQRIFASEDAQVLIQIQFHVEKPSVALFNKLGVRDELYYLLNNNVTVPLRYYGDLDRLSFLQCDDDKPPMPKARLSRTLERS